MFKPSQPMMARLRLTTKQVNGGYYKGNRTGSMGQFLKKTSRYVIDLNKVRTYVVPEGLESFKLTPFVTKRAEPKRSIYTKKIERNGRKVTAPRALEGQDFLNLWSERNGPEVLQERKKIAERERIEAMAEMAEASETKSRNSTPVG